MALRLLTRQFEGQRKLFYCVEPLLLLLPSLGVVHGHLRFLGMEEQPHNAIQW